MEPEELLQVDEVLAYHEAGHAVVAWSLSVPIHEIIIGSNGGKVRDKLKWHQLSPEWIGSDDKEWARKTAQILLGGEFAERAYNFYHNCHTDIYGSDGDRAELAAVIDGLFGSFNQDAEKWLHAMEDQAEKVVENHWGKIQALATALSSSRHLTGDEVMQIIQKWDSRLHIVFEEWD